MVFNGKKVNALHYTKSRLLPWCQSLVLGCCWYLHVCKRTS